MNTETMFIEAARTKLRFPTTKGSLSVEDLWDLPLESRTGKVNLNELAINAYNQLEASPKVSFVTPVAPKDTVNELRLEILKYVIAVKQSENAAKVAAADKAEEKRKLIDILQRKRDNAKEELSEAELIAKINAL